MRRGRTIVWAIIGSGVVAVAAVLVAIQLGSDSSAGPGSSPASSGSATGGSRAGASTPVVAPEPGAFYLSEMKPAGDLAQLVTPGPVEISGSIYPKSISFYCNVGDQTPFPRYTLARNDRRFQATIGLAPESPPEFEAGVMLIGDGRTLRTLTVSVPKPQDVDIDVHGVHVLQLECFGGGNSATGGEAVSLGWGNARLS
jgi:hypothetical protein